MKRPATVLFATLLIPATVGRVAAQNVLGAEMAPTSPAEVQQQLERQRHDLDAMNQRNATCEQQRVTEEKTLIGGSLSQLAGTPTIGCAP
jgi:hypothetical protein